MTTQFNPTQIQTVLVSVTECGKCKKEATQLLCGKCFSQAYCGKECQTAHWKEHKQVCPLLLKMVEESYLLVLADAPWKPTDQIVTTTTKIAPLLKQFFSENVNGKIAVDLGCGTGAAAQYLANLGWSVIAIDCNEEALKMLRKDASQSLVIVKANIEEYKFPKEVHLVVANDVLSYCNPEKVVEIWSRVYKALAVGGHFIGSFFIQENGMKPGTWGVKSVDFVKSLLEESNYFVEKCQYRLKKGNIVDFSAKKLETLLSQK